MEIYNSYMIYYIFNFVGNIKFLFKFKCIITVNNNNAIY